ncbi:MAG: alkaline phosphatase family protein [Acidimicrobiales bacterium]
MRPRAIRRLCKLAAAGVAGAALAACSGPPAVPPPATRHAVSSLRGSPPCGRVTRTAGYRHVMWVVMENKSYSSIIGSAAAPYENALARRCGTATDYSAVAHPSLPNYLALTGGSTFGVRSDEAPSNVSAPGASIFSQVAAAGLQWRSYEESMPTRCALGNSGAYAVRHNPATYYTSLRSACSRWDVPMGTVTSGPLRSALYGGHLPSFSFVTPNTCDDMHSCPVRTGDTWLAAFMGMVLRSPAYDGGTLAIVVTWDEGESTNQVPAIVVSPSTRVGVRSASPFDHYSLLRTTEDLLHLPHLRSAAGARSMAKAFGL